MQLFTLQQQYDTKHYNQSNRNQHCRTLIYNAKAAPGKQVGDTVAFGGLLGSAPVMPVNRCSAAEFIARGGRIPAPLHSLKN